MTSSSLLSAFVIVHMFATLIVTQTSARGWKWRHGVVDLTEDNFAEQVLDSDDHWLVMFYAPWCPYSQDLKPTFEDAARAIREEGRDIKLGAVDVIRYKAYDKKYLGRGYPTVRHFLAGSKTLDGSEEVKERSLSGLLEWAEELSANSTMPAEPECTDSASD